MVINLQLTPASLPKRQYKSEIQWFQQWMHTYLNNNSAKFYSHLIWNDGALGFFEEVANKKKKSKKNKMSIAIWNQKSEIRNGLIKTQHTCINTITV